MTTTKYSSSHNKMALHHIDNKMALLEGSNDCPGLTEGEMMSFEGSNDGSLDAEDLTEGHVLFGKMKLRSRGIHQEHQDSITVNIQGSQGTNGIVCELPSKLMGGKSKSNNKKREIFRFPRTRATFSKSHSADNSVENSIQSRSSSYMGPKPMGADGKPLKSCLSSNNSLASLSDSNDQSHHAPKLLKWSVLFDQVHIREHERALGDDPSVSSGAPLTIGWRSSETCSLPIDKYEEVKPEARTKEEFLVPACVRDLMLQEQAIVTSRDLLKAVKEANIAKNQRRRTVAMLGEQGLHETVEMFERKLKRVITGKSKEKEKEELWENAQMDAVSRGR